VTFLSTSSIYTMFSLCIFRSCYNFIWNVSSRGSFVELPPPGLELIAHDSSVRLAGPAQPPALDASAAALPPNTPDTTFAALRDESREPLEQGACEANADVAVPAAFAPHLAWDLGCFNLLGAQEHASC
jgi:hypothetical protein